MNKLIGILAVLVIFMTSPDPARGIEWPADSSQCEQQWEMYLTEANSEGRVIHMEKDALALFATAADNLEEFGDLPLKFSKAFHTSKVAYIFIPRNTYGRIYFIGLWNLEKCDGAIITIPTTIYSAIMNSMGQGI